MKRLVLWPVVFLLYFGEALEAFRFRMWMAMWITANWALGDKNHAELAVILLKKEYARTRLKIRRRGQ